MNQTMYNKTIKYHKVIFEALYLHENIEFILPSELLFIKNKNKG